MAGKRKNRKYKSQVILDFFTVSFPLFYLKFCCKILEFFFLNKLQEKSYNFIQGVIYTINFSLSIKVYSANVVIKCKNEIGLSFEMCLQWLKDSRHIVEVGVAT